MSTELRQELLTLAKELPSEKLPEAIALLHTLTDQTPTTQSNADFDKAMQMYKKGSEKYKNALRELA